MGYDAYGVIYNPRIGDGSVNADDIYDIPGSTKIDGSKDTENEKTRIEVGASDIYSTTPTPEEINSGSGINQTIAVARRRILQYNSLFGTTMTVPNYWTEGKRFATNWNQLRGLITTLRSTEGLSAYSSFPTVASKDRMLGSHLAHLRKALRISGVFATARGPHSYYLRRDNPFNTKYDSSVTADLWSTYVGHYGMSGGYYLRYRWAKSIAIPDWMNVAPSSGTVEITAYGGQGGVWQLRFAAWNTPKPTPTTGDFEGGDWFNLADPVSYIQADLLNPADIITFAGGYITVLIGVETELNNVSTVGYVGEIVQETAILTLNLGS